MKKTICTLILTLCAVMIFAQDVYTDTDTDNEEEILPSKKKSDRYVGDFDIGAEVKTGVYWEKREDLLAEPTQTTKTRTLEEGEDNLKYQGRFRINAGYYNTLINVGFKFRINWEEWKTPAPNWDYAFAYAKFFQDQFILSLGKLGASPWGSGGPEMYAEHESAVGTSGGIRFEYEPRQVPGLNVGFVLNDFNGDGEPWTGPVPLYEYLMESVIGASYTFSTYRPWFHVRAAIRLDSKTDHKKRGHDEDWGKEGVNLIYRVEEYALDKVAPGLRFWAMGYIYGIGANENVAVDCKDIKNWFFLEYDHRLFLTQLRVGIETLNVKTTVYVKPSFYFTLLNDLLMIGAAFEYSKYFYDGGSDYVDSWYSEVGVKPLFQVNVTPNAYVAFEYSFKRVKQPFTGAYKDRGILDPFVQTQYINIRAGVSF